MFGWLPLYARAHQGVIIDGTDVIRGTFAGHVHQPAITTNAWLYTSFKFVEFLDGARMDYAGRIVAESIRVCADVKKLDAEELTAVDDSTKVAIKYRTCNGIVVYDKTSSRLLYSHEKPDDSTEIFRYCHDGEVFKDTEKPARVVVTPAYVAIDYERLTDNMPLTLFVKHGRVTHCEARLQVVTIGFTDNAVTYTRPRDACALPTMADLQAKFEEFVAHPSANGWKRHTL
jgi:hypothetical protein